jgi:hypothetical protein
MQPSPPGASSAAGTTKPTGRAAATATTAPGAAPGTATRNAYDIVEAERSDAQSGTRSQADGTAGGGAYVTAVSNGDWLEYTGVDFTGTAPRAFTARAASGLPTGVRGVFQVRVDSPTSAPIVSFNVQSTGGWQSYVAYAATATAPTGVHTVFVSFTLDAPGDMINLDWIRFNGPHG